MTPSSSTKMPPAAAKLSLLDNFDENKIAEWFTVYGKNIVYAIAGLLALIAIIYAVSSGFSGKPEQDYLQAASDFAYFTKADADSALSADAYKRLQTLMSKYPELHATYDGALAQAFLNRNNLAQAKPYAEATLARTKSDNLPHYAEYSSTTLLIAAQKYDEALDKAKALQLTMTGTLANSSPDELAFGGELFALNLLRIAMLQQQLNDHSGELATWQQWKQYAGLSNSKSLNVNVDQQAFRAVIQQLAVGSISLPDYIAYREKALSN